MVGEQVRAEKRPWWHGIYSRAATLRQRLRCQTQQSGEGGELDRLTRIEVFVRVAERGGFSAAARDLGLSQSAVSKAVTALEQGLGVRLVQRSSRAVALTEAGQTYYRHCRTVLAELERAEAAVAGVHGELRGTLRIAAPVPFGLAFISSRAARFQALHPGLAVTLELDDRLVDLIEEKIDIAIRIGAVGGEGLAARRLGDSPLLTVAAPAYLARRGCPVTPEQLRDHDGLLYCPTPGDPAWGFQPASAAAPVWVPARYRSNNLLALKDAALTGLGVARLPAWMVAAEIEAGTLTALLDDYPPPPLTIYAVFPSARRIPARARLFADFIQGELGATALARLARLVVADEGSE